MRKFLLATIAAISVSTAFSQAPQQPESLSKALKITQALTTLMCGEGANLDPNSIKENSTAFAFIAALMHAQNYTSSASTRTILDIAELIEKNAPRMKCNSAGILDLT